MNKKIMILVALVLLVGLLAACSEKSDNDPGTKSNVETGESAPVTEPINKTDDSDAPEENGAKSAPVIDSIETFPLPTRDGWIEESYKITEYEDSGINIQAAFSFDGNIEEETAAYRELIENTGYTIGNLSLSDMFKLNAVFADKEYHITVTFGSVDDDFQDYMGPMYVEMNFDERQP